MKMKAESLSLQTDLSPEDLEFYTQSGMVAVDCEMTGLNPYRDQLSLVQICDRTNQVRLIRSQDWAQSPRLWTLMKDPQVMKIFHFAIMDCAFLLRASGVQVENAYCTKIASKLARTYTEEHSLFALTKELMSIELNKNEQTSFWGAAELTSKQLNYAAHDVLYLIELREKLMAILDQKGRLPTGITYLELNQQCQNFIPSLVHLWVNGWDFGRQERSAAAIFGR